MEVGGLLFFVLLLSGASTTFLHIHAHQFDRNTWFKCVPGFFWQERSQRPLAQSSVGKALDFLRVVL